MKKIILIISCFAFFSSAYTQNKIGEKRVVVLSGGGSRGAWGAGFLKMMDSIEHPDYVGAIGTSTGSLLGPLILSNNPKKFDILYRGYTDVDQHSIFNANPFKTDGSGDVNGLKAIFRFITFHKNLGESKPLKKRIGDFYTSKDYEELTTGKKEFIACVTNLTSGAIEYKSSQDPNNGYKDMLDWVWASCNQPVFMSTLKKNNSLYVDGGLRENIPIVQGVQLALQQKVTRVDIIIHNSTDTTSLRPWPLKNPKRNGIIPKIFRVIDIFSDETRLSDVIAGSYLASQLVEDGKKIELHFYSIPIQVFQNLNCYNSLIFDKERQKKMWEAGMQYYNDLKKKQDEKGIGPDLTIPKMDIFLNR